MEKTLKSHLKIMEIKPVNPKGNQPWIYIRRTDAETSIFGYLVLKSWLTKKDPDAAKDWGQEEKGGTESEMVRWHPWLNGHEFEQTLGDSKRQGILVCCNSWVTKRVGHSLETEQQQHLHTAFSSCLLPHSLPPPFLSIDWKKGPVWELWVTFCWGKMRTTACETGFLIALRNCSKEELLPDLQFCSLISGKSSVSCYGIR